MTENSHTFDLAIIGAGPGGYVSAIYASQRGMKVGVVEADALGGVCLNWGCIPTKALLKNAEVVGMMKKLDEFGITAENVSWDFSKAVERSRNVVARENKGIEYLFKKNKIQHFMGKGILNDGKTIQVRDKNGIITAKIQADRLLFATGSRPKTIMGLQVDGKIVHDSTSAMLLKELPDSMVIIGAGAVGVEYAYVFAMYGVKVTLIEMLPQILPVEDTEISEILAREFKKLGIIIHTETSISEIKSKKSGVTLQIKKKGKEEAISADSLLLAVGRAPNTENIGLERNGIGLDNGFIRVNEHFQTAKPNIYAIGDVIGMPLLAHKAMQEGIIAVDNMLDTEKKTMNRHLMPGCTYCQPQVASIGMTEEKARKAGFDVSIGKFPFRANGKAMAVGEETGMVKVVVDKKFNELLGVHIIGAEATDLIAEAGVLLSLECTVDEIKDIVHAHPTLAEAVKEAALAATTGAIHA